MDLFDFQKLAKREFDELVKSSGIGDLESQRKLTKMYYLGWGVNESIKLGLKKKFKLIENETIKIKK